jgi:16S rRNA G966 N2-methylase RsmD
MAIQIHCKYDELVNPKKLKNHPKNRNKHGQDQIDRLAELYKYHGIRHPIIVSNLSKCIVAGHGRKLAAIRAGISEMPVVYQDFESSEAEYAFIQADNAIALWAELDLAGINADIGDLGPDFDINMLGIQDFEIEPADKYQDKDADLVPDDVEPVAKLGQIYRLGEHRLMCGDSTDESKIEILLDKTGIDMVFTDPPYGISVVLKNGSVGGTVGKYRQVLNDETTDVAELSYRICERMNTNLVFWGANHYSNVFPSSSCWIVWDKQGGKRVTFADCELAYTNIKKPARLFKHIWDGFRRDSERGEMRVHPTQKPVKLIEDIFELFKEESKKNILDLFGGSGSTLIACEKTNRKCFMMELDPHYVDVIIARWEKFTSKKAELLNG